MADDEHPTDEGDYYYTIGERLVEANERPQRCFVSLSVAQVIAGLFFWAGIPLLASDLLGVAIWIAGVIVGIFIFFASIVWCWLGEELEYWYGEYMGHK